MKHTKNRVMALLLALAMVLSLMPMAFAADEFPDMPAEDDPSYAAVKSAVDNGIMTGDNGMLNLEDNILRSTVSKMLAVAFAAKGEADVSGFSDVADGAWYAEWMAKANQMGIMTGDNGKMDPSRNVTLQEVATMLVRVLGLPLGTAEDLANVPGAGSVSAWAIPAVAALVKAGYISDVTDAGLPMNRRAFAEVIYKVSGDGNYVSEGEITTDVNGNIVITADGVSLKGITVTGDVIIADGVDAGTIILDDVTIEGRLVVRGGAETKLSNGTSVASTVVAAPAGETAIVADVTSDAGDITVAGTNGKVADKVTLDMAEPKVAVNAATEVAVQNANGGEVTMNAAGSLSVESGKLGNVTVAASGAAVDVAAGATIEMVTTNTDITITGEGKVEEKTGSGTVTDASGNEVGGSDEPADIPDVPDLINRADPPSVTDPGDAPDEAEAVDTSATIPEGVDENNQITTEPAEGVDQHDCSFTGDPVVVEPTCTTAGTSTVTCSQEGCGATQTTYTAATGHTAKETPDKYVAGNCLGAGYASYSCEDCGTKNVTVTTSGSITVGDRSINLDKQAHSVGSYVTKTVEGTQKHFTKCANCQQEYGDGEACAEAEDATWTVTATGHSARCETCNTKLTYAHDNTGAEAEGTAPTCTAAGKAAAKTCSECGYVHPADSIPATGHDWGDWTEEGAPEGKLIRTCRNGCESTQTKNKPATTEPDEGEEVPPVVHNAVQAWSKDSGHHWHACSVTGCTEHMGAKAHGYAVHSFPQSKDSSCECGQSHTCDNTDDTTVACGTCGWKTTAEPNLD
ncbi:MAG: S-layer homology domain-containing protein [Clostridiales bacterium]|nr:S-layer homology domain-containing protein [Clostridiales bacterium]